MLLYVVTMYRFADREKHSYVLGVFDDEMLALKEAEKEQIYRGGNKYYPEVIKYELNGLPIKVVHNVKNEINALTKEEREAWGRVLNEKDEV